MVSAAPGDWDPMEMPWQAPSRGGQWGTETLVCTLLCAVLQFAGCLLDNWQGIQSKFDKIHVFCNAWTAGSCPFLSSAKQPGTESRVQMERRSSPGCSRHFYLQSYWTLFVFLLVFSQTKSWNLKHCSLYFSLLDSIKQKRISITLQEKIEFYENRIQVFT